MTIRLDPEESETTALFSLIDFTGHNVLEIGCGDGRLTWRYAAGAAHVTAIDAYAESIRRAHDNVTADLKEHVEFQHVAFQDFAAGHRTAMFDTCVLSWSL